MLVVAVPGSLVLLPSFVPSAAALMLHGPVKTPVWSLILFIVPHPNYIMLHYVVLAECQ